MCVTQTDLRDSVAALSPQRAKSSDGTPGCALVVCPSLLVREGMVRLLERAGGAGALYAASTMEFGLQLHQALRPTFMWVHEEADPHFSFLRLFAERPGTRRVAVLLRPGPRAGERTSLAFQAGAFAAFDAACAVEQLLEGLRVAVQGRSHVSPTLRQVGRPGRLPTTRGGPADLLTDRESQVLRLMAEGLQNRQIADILFISIETVRTHAKSTMRKLGAQGRADAVARGFRLRILSPDNFSAPSLVPMPRPRRKSRLSAPN
jgi:DNA-binding NarL/FixJ family response regulator